MRVDLSRGSHFESDGAEEAYFNSRRLLFTNRSVDTNISSQPPTVSLDTDINVAATNPTDHEQQIPDNPIVVDTIPFNEGNSEVLIDGNSLLETIMLMI